MTAYDSLAGLVRLRPLSTPLPAATYDGSYSSPFSASWTSTVEVLTREVEHLQAREAVLEVDLREQDFRNDGLPRANARAASPGVILSLLGTPHGDLRYPAHAFHDWQSNVRALALALEALRKVDRYGVTKRGEQYAGWRALPAGSGPSAERGRAIVDSHGGNVRRAELATHPDTRGPESAYTDADFAHVQAYKESI